MQLSNEPVMQQQDNAQVQDSIVYCYINSKMDSNTVLYSEILTLHICTDSVIKCTVVLECDYMQHVEYQL